MYYYRTVWNKYNTHTRTHRLSLGRFSTSHKRHNPTRLLEPPHVPSPILSNSIPRGYFPSGTSIFLQGTLPRTQDDCVCRRRLLSAQLRHPPSHIVLRLSLRC